MASTRSGSSFSWLLALGLAAAATIAVACGGDDAPADAPSGDAPMCNGTIAYLQACTDANECQSCVCQSFGHSQVCTKTCTLPEDCPAPSGGCSNGFCRP